MSTRVDIRTTVLQHGATLERAFMEFGREAERAVHADATTGHLHVSENELRAAAANVFAERTAENVVATIVGYASGGILRTEGSGVDFALPWMALEDVAYMCGGAPPSVRTALGLGTASDGAQVAFRLHRRYRMLPADVFAPSTARILLRRPFAHRANGHEPPEPPEVDPVEPPVRRRPGGGITGVSAAPSPPPNIYVAAAGCLVGGTWSGWWDGWSGWLPGWKLCLDYQCADTLATLLLTLVSPGVTDLRGAANAIYQLIAGDLPRFSLAVQSAMLSFLALAVIGFALGMNLKLVNGPRGACILCSWPHTGGFYFWATGR